MPHFDHFPCPGESDPYVTPSPKKWHIMGLIECQEEGESKSVSGWQWRWYSSLWIIYWSSAVDIRVYWGGVWEGEWQWCWYSSDWVSKRGGEGERVTVTGGEKLRAKWLGVFPPKLMAAAKNLVTPFYTRHGALSDICTPCIPALPRLYFYSLVVSSVCYLAYSDARSERNYGFQSVESPLSIISQKYVHQIIFFVMWS